MFYIRVNVPLTFFFNFERRRKKYQRHFAITLSFLLGLSLNTSALLDMTSEEDEGIVFTQNVAHLTPMYQLT